MLQLILAVAIAQNPVVMVAEPLPPTRWNLITQANCYDKPLIFSGYGASVHTGGIPKVTFGGRPLNGPSIGQLITDLSTVGAIYRFSIQCGRTGEITLRIYEGGAQRDGRVNYRAALASVKDGRLNYYSGLKPADAETFWYR